MDQSLSPIPTFIHALRLFVRHSEVMLLPLPFLGVAAAVLLLLISSVFGGPAFLRFGLAIGFLPLPYAVLASHLLAQPGKGGVSMKSKRLARRFGNMVVLFTFLTLAAALLFLLGEMLDSLPAVGSSLSSLASLALGYVEIRMMVLPSVVAVEDHSIVDSIRRTWSLTGSKHWRTVVVAILTFVGCLIVVTASSVLLEVALEAGSERGEEGWWGAWGIMLGFGLGSALSLSFAIAVQAAVYLRLTSGEASSDVGMEGSASVG